MYVLPVVSGAMNLALHFLLCLLHFKYFLGVIVVFFFSAPESERRPLSTLISHVFVYRFEPGSFLPPWSGLSVAVIKVLFTPRM